MSVARKRKKKKKKKKKKKGCKVFSRLSLRFINMFSNFPSSMLFSSDRECSVNVSFDFALVYLCFCLLSFCIRWSPDTSILSYLTQTHLPLVPLHQIWLVSLLSLIFQARFYLSFFLPPSMLPQGTPSSPFCNVLHHSAFCSLRKLFFSSLLTIHITQIALVFCAICSRHCSQ